ncbi:MAG: putative endopeptidase [Pyrinomonadaceae bacterium]|jgi:predicted metalloendopeptidase|nr:putative endopeptidase [Pyrinomonadaceae bacterium]
MRKLLTTFAIAAALVCSLAFANRSSEAAHLKTTSASVPTIEAGKLPGFDVGNMDTSVSACANFFQYANGGWIAKNQIPAAFSRWGRFEVLDEQNIAVLHGILDGLLAKKSLKAGTNEQKIADYYRSCMDEPGIEGQGVTPLQPEFDRIAAINDVAGLQAEIARFHAYRIPAVFGFGGAQDFKNSQAVIAQAVQGGLGLPDRDYYTKDDQKSRQTREEYQKHVARMFELLGDPADRSTAESQTVLAIETKLAENSTTRVQRRDPEANYHPMNRTELSALTPHFDWRNYFDGVGLPTIDKINVGQPDFFKAADKLLTSISLDDWKSYLRWHLLNSTAGTLSAKFVEEDFNFSGKYLQGTKEMQPRWRRCIVSTDRSLGEALGQLYIQKTFTPAARLRAQEMVKNLVEALRSDLTTLNWMSDDTRKKAISKLDAFIRKIGYPDKWRSYEALQVSPGPFYNNTISARQFEVKRNLGKIGKPVDKTEWGMSPPTVNAYYNPSINEIVFPAGILQPPFYDPKADDAFNYGGIGVVIGHEMTHGFDDTGARFDANGNLAMWWTPDDFKKFKERTDCVVKQFDGYEVEPGLNQNGKLVVGESVADLGGLAVAYAAYQKSLNGKPGRVIAGFTPEQRFFLGYAQIWAQNIRPEAARLRVATDPHPLGRFRVNGPLSNMELFATAFQCKAGDQMVRPADKRCQIW